MSSTAAATATTSTPTTTAALATVGGYTLFPEGFTWTVCVCLCLSFAASVFIACAVACRNGLLSVAQSPYSLVLAQALFEAVFAGTLLVNFFVTEPGMVVLQSGGLGVSFNVSGDEAVLELCRAWPSLGALLAASIAGAELCSIFLAFDIRGFSAGPFGQGVKCCRVGLCVFFFVFFSRPSSFLRVCLLRTHARTHARTDAPTHRDDDPQWSQQTSLLSTNHSVTTA